MEEVEQAYFVDRPQLLLLLSLLDERSVAGFPLDVPNASPEMWKQVALSLLREKRLIYEANRLTVAPAWRAWLQTMKDASEILALYSKRETLSAVLIYRGTPSVAVAEHGTSEYRVWQLDSLDMDDFAELTALPEAPETESSGLEIAHRMKTIAEEAVSPTEPMFVWGERQNVRVVAERYRPDGTRISRWVWLDDPQCGLAALRQDDADCTVLPDSRKRRETFLLECRLSGAGTVHNEGGRTDDIGGGDGTISGAPL